MWMLISVPIHSLFRFRWLVRATRMSFNIKEHKIRFQALSDLLPRVMVAHLLAGCRMWFDNNNNNLNLFTHGGLSVSCFSKGRVKLWTTIYDTNYKLSIYKQLYKELYKQHLRSQSTSVHAVCWLPPQRLTLVQAKPHSTLFLVYY